MSAPSLSGTGKSCSIQFATDSVYTTIPYIVDVTGIPGLESADVSTTTIDSAVETSQPGRATATPLSLTCRYAPTIGSMLYSYQLAQSNLNWKVTFSNAGTTENSGTTNSMIAFVGYVQKFTPIGNADHNGALIGSLDVKVSGSLTIT